MLRELQRLSKDLSDLQQYIYKDIKKGEVVSVEQIPTHTSSNNSLESAVASRMFLKIQAIGNQLRQVTGKLEELEFSISALGGRLDRLVGDVDLRLQMLETSLKSEILQKQAVQKSKSQQFSSMPSNPVQQSPIPQSLPKIKSSGINQLGIGQGTTIITSTGATGVPTIERTIPSGSKGLLAGQKSLGLVTGSQLAAAENNSSSKLEKTTSNNSLQTRKQLGLLPKGDREPPSLLTKPKHTEIKPTVSKQSSILPKLPPGTPKQKYDHAFSLLQKREYSLAEQALRAFIELYPNDQYAGNAYYWLGETYYVRKQWQDAAIIFADGYKRSPKGTKAPDNLLKLGKSLTGLGEKALACKTYAELLTKFPSANTRILDNANSELSRVGCE